MMTSNAYTIGKILEWLQRIIVLYSLGEDELPREYKVLLNRYSLKDDIHDADKCILYQKNISSIVGSYEIKITTPDNSFSFESFMFKHQQTISVRFIIVDSDNFWDINSRNNIITIIISKDILDVSDLKKSIKSIDSICIDLCTLLDIPCFKIWNINTYELCINIISYYFIKSIFTDVDWSVVISYHPSEIIAKEFVLKNTNDIKSYEQLISKIINEDDGVWGFIVNALVPFKSGFDKYSESK